MATRTGLSAYIPVNCGVPVEARNGNPPTSGCCSPGSARGTLRAVPDRPQITAERLNSDIRAE